LSDGLAEHAFVNRTDASEMFRNAISVLDLAKAEQAARWMAEQHPLSPAESVELVILMLVKHDERVEEASERWVKSLMQAGGSEAEADIARAAMRGMEDRKTVLRCERVLRLISSGIGR
jgi:hypothetical protein